MGDLKSLKLAAALVVVSLTAGLIHPDTRAGLLAGWRPSVEEALQMSDPSDLSPAAKLIYYSGQFPAGSNTEALSWRMNAINAALDSEDLVLMGVAARLSSLGPPYEIRVSVPPDEKRLKLIELRTHLLNQGTALDPDNAFWWMEKAATAAILGKDTDAENYLIRAHKCDRFVDFGWDELDVRRSVSKELIGVSTQESESRAASAILFPHFASHRATARRLIAGRPLEETARLRLSLARLGLLVSDDSQTMIGQLVGLSLARLSLTKPSSVDSGSSTKGFVTTEEFEQVLIRLGLEDDRSWRVIDPNARFDASGSLPEDISPILQYGPTMGYTSTWRGLLCGILMGLGLWLARRWADSGWLSLIRPGLATASIAGIIITFGTPANSMLVVVAVLSASVISALCLAYRRAHVLFPVFALVAPQVALALDHPFFPDQLLAFIGSLAAIGSYFLAWKPDHKASRWIASTLPIVLLALAIYVGMRVGNYSSEYDHGLLGNPLHRTVSEPAFTPVFFWCLGFTVLATLACLQKERVTALVQAKSVATFTAILVASSVLYTGVMEAQSRDAIRQFKSETRHLESQLGEALRKADYPSPAANNPAWKR